MIDKKELGEIFSAIAPRYDFLNHLLSFNVDKRWRRALVDHSGMKPGEKILDACTGTGDIAIEFALRYRPGKIVGVDISDKMLGIAQRKIEKLHLTGKITLQRCDCLALPFANESFDVVTIGFGLRNLTDYQKGLSEMARVLKTDGRLLILEFSRPRNVILSGIYRFYLNTLVVFAGGIVSGSKRAYEYLPSSIKGFLDHDGVLKLMQTGDLKDCRFKKLAGGIACIYYGRK